MVAWEFMYTYDYDFSFSPSMPVVQVEASNIEEHRPNLAAGNDRFWFGWLDDAACAQLRKPSPPYRTGNDANDYQRAQRCRSL